MQLKNSHHKELKNSHHKGEKATKIMQSLIYKTPVAALHEK